MTDTSKTCGNEGNIFSASNGTAASPGYGFENSPNSGFSYDGVGIVTSVSGTKRARITTTTEELSVNLSVNTSGSETTPAVTIGSSGNGFWASATNSVDITANQKSVAQFQRTGINFTPAGSLNVQPSNGGSVLFTPDTGGRTLVQTTNGAMKVQGGSDIKQICFGGATFSSITITAAGTYVSADIPFNATSNFSTTPSVICGVVGDTTFYPCHCNPRTITTSKFNAVVFNASAGSITGTCTIYYIAIA